MAAPVKIRSESDARRDTLRPAFGRPGTMRIANEPAIEVTIADLTRDGCRILTDAIVPVASACRIGIGNVGLTEGLLVWQRAGEYGCAFTFSLPPGAITAAFGGSNVASLPIRPGLSTEIEFDAKLSPRARTALILMAVPFGWGLVFGVSALML